MEDKMEKLSKNQKRKLRKSIKHQLGQYSFSELETSIIERLNLDLLTMLVARLNTLQKRTKCIRCNKFFDGVIPMLGHCQSIHKIGEPKQIRTKPFKLKAAKKIHSKEVIIEHKSVHSNLLGITSSRDWKKTK